MAARGAESEVGEQELGSAKDWSVYLLRCGDGTLYCGIARDVERRIHAHSTPRGARYVRAHGGVSALLWSLPCQGQSAALRAELWVKAQPRKIKEALVRGAMTVPLHAMLPKDA